MASEKAAPKERKRTDESLAVERSKTDTELTQQAVQLEERSDAVVARARDQANEFLASTRAKVDQVLDTTEFVVRIPDAAAEPLHTKPQDPPLVRTERTRRRGLVVDDNEDAVEMLSLALSDSGYEVVTALDGLAALDRLRSFQADAAVVDLGLPVMHRFELVRHIREEFHERCPRLIAVTGYGQPIDRERSKSAGFDAHLVKPVDFSNVVAAIEERRPA